MDMYSDITDGMITLRDRLGNVVVDLGRISQSQQNMFVKFRYTPDGKFGRHIKLIEDDLRMEAWSTNKRIAVTYGE